MELGKVERVRERTKREFSKIKDVVAEVLKETERARNEDSWLILCVLQRMGQDVEPVYDPALRRTVIVWRIVDIRDVVSFETITRCRRQVQNGEGRYLPTSPEVLLKRRIRQDAVREHYGGNV